MTDTATLQARLAEAEAAYHALVTGRREVSVSYTQGETTRSVTYTQADLARLAGYIMDLKRQLGLGRRRAIGVRF